jgi:hypothetical protein
MSDCFAPPLQTFVPVKLLSKSRRLWLFHISALSEMSSRIPKGRFEILGTFDYCGMTMRKIITFFDCALLLWLKTIL